jgi:hypothetical protein
MMELVEDAVTYVEVTLLAIFQLIFNCYEERVPFGGFLNGSIPFSFDVILELKVAKLYSITLPISKNILRSISRRL